MDVDQVKTLRNVIDQIDRDLMELLSRRLEVAREIGAAKEGGAVYDPKREEALVKRLAGENPHLGEPLIRAVMGEIIGACRAVQGPFRVVLMGPKWSYSHEVAEKVFGSSWDPVFVRSPREALCKVAVGGGDAAVVPIENSTEGAVHSTLDGLMELKGAVWIAREARARVEHCLANQGDDLGRIRRVYSHPQAMSQCWRWLSQNLPQAELVEANSTSEGALRALDEGEAAVCGIRCAREMGFRMVIPGIQDSPLNTTRFIVVTRREEREELRYGDRTSILFTLPHRPGSLCEALGALSEHKINLMMIQSRPIPKNPFEYAFFADIDGGLGDPKVEAAVNEMAKRTSDLTVLGSYCSLEI
ncbi:prephenate dehydratase [Thermanaerovibrio velox DSM 12556]|uniref:Bifunctional chorismate mutase/prephenate dehydratase n=2 Tax=Thermanaerovibrio TaxID=81461 RepID=H0UQB1_9BACT|nr:prephenate dehydratase [Thermanaerovibrio velox DSM 12556]